MARPRPVVAVLLLLMAVGAGPSAVAASTAAPALAVTAADPDVRAASLAIGEAVFLRVPYTTEVPIRIVGRPYRSGAPVQEGRPRTHASPRYGPGSGDALVWLAFDEAAAIDEIRIEAVAAEGWPSVLAAVTMAVDVRWTDVPASASGARAPWVAEMRARHEAALGERRGGPPGPDWVWDAVVGLMFVSVPSYVVIQGIALWLVRGRWRLAARGPLVVMGLAYVLTVVGAGAGRSLTPLFVVVLSPLALSYLVVILFLHFRSPTARTV